jgi:PAS domain S-box-containing protein
LLRAAAASESHMRSLNLKAKMTVGVSTVVIVSLSVAAYFAISYFEKRLKATIAGNQFLMASAVANEIDQKLLMAHQQLILLSREVPPAALRDPGMAQRFLDSKAYLTGFFDNHYGVFSVSGISIAEAPFTPNRRGMDFSFRPYVKRALETRRPVISDPYLSSQAHNHPAIMMLAPIFNSKGTMIGFLVGSMDLMGDNILGDIAKIKIGKAGYLSLTTADRIMVMHPDRNRIMKPIPMGNKLYDAAVSGFEGTDETVTTGGIAMVTSVKRMKVNGWIIVASYPQAEAYAAISEMKPYLLGGSAVTVAGVFLMISYLIGRFTAPLAQFTRHVKELPDKEGAGKQFPLDSDDEIGTLSRAFNSMLAKLEQQQGALRESEALFRTLAERSLVGIYLIQDGVYRYVNPRFAEIFKYSIDELTDKFGPQDLTHPADWPDTKELIRKRIDGEAESVHYSFRGMTKAQEIVDAEVYGSATYFSGRPAIIGTLLDITDRKRAEIALQESEERFRELADSLPQAVFEIDVQGRFVYVNRTGLEMFGYTKEEGGQGLHVAEMVAPQDRERALLNIKARMSGNRNEHHEYTALRKDGTTFPATVHSIPVMREGRLAGLRGILIDITDRKRLETEVLRSQKLESIGVLAGGLAHDFNNVLTAILGNLSFAKMSLNTDDPLYQPLVEAEKASLHARDLTQQLLTFARGGRPIKRVTAVEPLIRDATSFALRGRNVRAEFRFSPDLGTVEADAGQIGQVFNNIILNACQAMPEGGTIVISAENHRLAAGPAVPVPAGDYVRVQIEDHGTGIPAEHITKIFDPYFTTKRQGSGLGLAIAYSVLKGHGGYIDVASTPGKGTTFILYLPSAAGKAASPDESATVVIAGKGRVLVMDDEEMIRSVATVMLNSLGYMTTTARDGKEAIRLYREARDTGKAFDAVIMDLTVPGGMGGKDAVRELRAFDPHVKAIVSSGYSNDPVMADYRSYGFCGILKKPYQIAELSHALHRVIRGETP